MRGVQRPPVYNSEDYSEYLRKYCKLTGLQVSGQEALVKHN